MKITDLLKELNYILKENGDLEISISICNIQEFIKKHPKQNYIITQDIIPVVENFEEDNVKHQELCLRDWQY